MSSVNAISNRFYWKLKNIFLFLTRGLFFQFFANSHIQKAVSTLKMKLDVENDNAVSSLANVAYINVETDKVDSKLFNGFNSNVDVHKIVLTLIWHCLMLRRLINLKSLSKQSWNIWLVGSKCATSFQNLFYGPTIVFFYFHLSNIKN